jgi:transcriptional repressor NrdR
MKCPFCGKNESKVVDKRDTEGEAATRRRRECLSCQKRFTTYERLETLPITIVKKNGTREQFDRSKLVGGLLKAFEKRPASREEIENIANEIEAEIKAGDATEIQSKDIGDMIIRKLKKIDKVAYIRFASVYKDFQDIEEFAKELDKLIKK